MRYHLLDRKNRNFVVGVAMIVLSNYHFELFLAVPEKTAV
jgi:hypothetical protein